LLGMGDEKRRNARGGDRAIIKKKKDPRRRERMGRFGYRGNSATQVPSMRGKFEVSP